MRGGDVFIQVFDTFSLHNALRNLMNLEVVLRDGQASWVRFRWNQHLLEQIPCWGKICLLNHLFISALPASTVREVASRGVLTRRNSASLVVVFLAWVLVVIIFWVDRVVTVSLAAPPSAYHLATAHHHLLGRASRWFVVELVCRRLLVRLVGVSDFACCCLWKLILRVGGVVGLSLIVDRLFGMVDRVWLFHLCHDSSSCHAVMIIRAGILNGITSELQSWFLIHWCPRTTCRCLEVKCRWRGLNQELIVPCDHHMQRCLFLLSFVKF